MKRWKVWLGVAVIFVSGLVIGSLGTGLVVGLGVKRMVRRVTAGDTSVLTKVVMMKMRRDLRLTREQRRQIRPMVAAAIDRIRRLHDTLRPKIKQEIAKAATEISRHLTPKQRRRLQERLKLLRARWHPPRPTGVRPPVSP
jgi:Spy/CpxP family protein refolding chaperone